MEHNIYYGEDCICICSPSAVPRSSHDIFTISRKEEAASLAEMFRNGNIRGKAYLPSEDTEKVHGLFCSEFKEVNAAGGLVSDKEGRLLVIRRNGLWDLPKGHQEPGEDISATALREVSEETGVSGLALGKFLCTTEHCYLRDGIWHLKHTWWFLMTAGENVELVPQAEEDITEAVWFSADGLEDVMKCTYASISEVLRKYRADE